MSIAEGRQAGCLLQCQSSCKVSAHSPIDPGPPVLGDSKSRVGTRGSETLMLGLVDCRDTGLIDDFWFVVMNVSEAPGIEVQIRPSKDCVYKRSWKLSGSTAS